MALGAEVGGVLAVGAELVRLEVAGEGNEEVAAAPREAAVQAERPVAPVPPRRPNPPRHLNRLHARAGRRAPTSRAR